ncbi:putative F-box/LRR-repeat protein 9 [Setaria viridis]|uniref:putative F-box/LRR-repeat protein 9 n=1 Tax=Setaria viridis TaxID=4556 RepID=UPI003B3BB60D
MEAAGRDWSELPLDALMLVFARLGPVEILMGSGLVCRSWLQAAKEPELWRSVDMANHRVVEEMKGDVLYAMAKLAVDRSMGQLEVFLGKYFVTDELLKYLGARSASLKILSLTSCHEVSNKGFTELIIKFPLLEELEISLFTNIDGKHVFEEVGKACPELKRFRFNRYRFHEFAEYSDDDDSEFKYNKDDNALGIASMHGLRSLQLFGNNFTNEGLAAILDNCPHLESLDIRHCFNIVMDDALRAKCATIKTLRLPYDSTDGYGLQFEGPIWPGSGLGFDSDSDDCVYGGPDYILDSDEYDDYCDPLRYLDGVHESELGPEHRMFLKGMRMLMRDDSDDGY